jgi:membrane-bound serine protease (ClpP class)
MARAIPRLVVLTLLAGVCTAGELPEQQAAVISCRGLIDEGLYKSIRRRTETALDAGCGYLVYEISTYGGRLDSADDISKYLILDVGLRAHTAAFVTTEAISAGAMISVSCRDIIMLENTTIGDCAPVAIGGKLEGVEREKTESFTRAAFKRAAEANGYPEVLLKAMVTMGTEVWKVPSSTGDDYGFFEGDRLPDDPNAWNLEGKKLIVSETELLTLTASEALEYGIARATVTDLQGALRFLAERDGVVFPGEPLLLETNWSEEMVRWINSPAVMGILVMVALLGVYTELNSPGLGLPGLVAAGWCVVIVGSRYLTGLANWVEVALFLAGIVLLGVELFVLPGFGIAGIAGFFCLVAGFFGMLVRNPPDRLPWPQSVMDWEVLTDGLLGVAIGFVGFVVAAVLLVKYMPRMGFLSGLVLVPARSPAGSRPGPSMTAPQAGAGRIKIKAGDTGIVSSALRPAGRVQFGGAIVDCIADAEFVEAGLRVRVIEVTGNKIVVRAVTEGPDEGL